MDSPLEILLHKLLTYSGDLIQWMMGHRLVHLVFVISIRRNRIWRAVGFPGPSIQGHMTQMTHRGGGGFLGAPAANLCQVPDG